MRKSQGWTISFFWQNTPVPNRRNALLFSIFCRRVFNADANVGVDSFGKDELKRMSIGLLAQDPACCQIVFRGLYFS